MLGLSAFIAVTLPAKGKADDAALMKHLSPRDYTFSYWLQGRRGETRPEIGDILVFETGYYGLTLDMARLDQAQFGLLSDPMGYAEAVDAETSRIAALNNAALCFDIEVDGQVYRAKQLVMPENKKDFEEARSRLSDVWLWESGRIVQHIELNQVRFETRQGDVLPATARLTITAFPDVLTWAVQMNSSDDVPSWEGVKVELAFETPSKIWRTTHVIEDEEELKKEHLMGLACAVGPDRDIHQDITVSATHAESGKPYPTQYNPMTGCFVTVARKVDRNWDAGWAEIRNYDEFDIVIENRNRKTATVRYLLDGGAANMTGGVPILCKPDGTPTGIPVQISKDWHKPPRRGSFFRPYALIPVPPGKHQYKLRNAYGYYGTVPAASHAQLSLVGNGGNGRWDQLAIGCWGETMCFDGDMTLTRGAITDVRTLFVRNGKEGTKWKFTSGGWGGDWLSIKDNRGQKQLFSQMKTAYLTQGPCLTDVRYRGFFGHEHQARVAADVKTLRTDDYMRTFQDIEYEFRADISNQDSYLFKMGAKAWHTQSIVYGNADGELGTIQFSGGHKKGDRVLDRLELKGAAPWWVAFPESGEKRGDGRNWGQGSRALIIRSYSATFGGITYDAPSITLPVKGFDDDEWADVDLWLTPPEGINDFKQGDRVRMRTQWITLPRHVDDYYGPNEAFRKHLKKHSKSWKTVYREAKGNDLKVQVVGGILKNSYPIIIEAIRPDNIQVKINGGIGFVPIRFENLSSPNYALYRVEGGKRTVLDQSVHGNDFWQTDYVSVSGTYSLVFSLPLDDQGVSGWELKIE
ncbi:hypothetical protein P4E94_17880 [Pontiellaceae bacterium B12219]|nr:hypothetical protein [Pontiellaceae bacterium B12219]